MSLFERGSYAALVSSFSALPPALQAAPLARIYLARSHLALTPPALAAARAALAPLPSTLDIQALASFVQYLAAVQSKQDTAGALDELEMVLAELGEKGLEQSYDMAEGDAGEGRFVRAVVATVYILEGTDDKREEAIEILREGIELGQDQEWCVCTRTLASLTRPQSRDSFSSVFGAGPSEPFQDAAGVGDHDGVHLRLTALPAPHREDVARFGPDEQVPGGFVIPHRLSEMS